MKIRCHFLTQTGPKLWSSVHRDFSDFSCGVVSDEQLWVTNKACRLRYTRQHELGLYDQHKCFRD